MSIFVLAGWAVRPLLDLCMFIIRAKYECVCVCGGVYEGGAWMHVCSTCVHEWVIPQGGLPVNWVSRLLVSVPEAQGYIWASGVWCVCRVLL